MLSEALRRRQAEWEALLEEARAYAHRVREALGEARVYLFGSVARGEFNLESDIIFSWSLLTCPKIPWNASPFSTALGEVGWSPGASCRRSSLG
jgi:hypothetical protein